MPTRCPYSTVRRVVRSQPLPATLQATSRVRQTDVKAKSSYTTSLLFSGVSFPRYVPSIPFFTLAVGGLGPSHTENTNWPKDAPEMVNLSLPLMASVVPVVGT